MRLDRRGFARCRKKLRLLWFDIHMILRLPNLDCRLIYIVVMANQAFHCRLLPQENSEKVSHVDWYVSRRSSQANLPPGVA
jgi:hypothetical protein